MHDIGEQTNLVNIKEYGELVDSLSTKLESLLVEHNAEFPSRNPQYKGLSKSEKQALPIVEKHVYNKRKRLASIRLGDNKTPLHSAYLLATGKKIKRYERLEASIEAKPNTQTLVTAQIPTDIDEYLFVLIDKNNFMLQSDTFKVK